MNNGVPTSGRRRWARLALWLLPVWLPVLVVLLALVWLSSPLGRSWVEARIRGMTGLDARVGAVMVSPWNGVSLDRLDILQPPALRPLIKEPLVSIARIRITPVWKSWLHGKRELRAVELDSPRCVISVEMLGGLARPQTSIAPSTPPQPPPASPPAPAPAPDGPPPVVPPVAPQQPVRAGPSEAALPPTAWIHLKNASFTLVSASSGMKHVDVSGIDASIPVAGKTARSTLKVASAKVRDKPVISGFSTSLNWQAPMLSMESTETTVAGVKVAVAARTALTSGIPVQIDLRMPEQKPGVLQLGAESTADPGSVTAGARFIGLTLAPSTWQGDLVLETIAPSARCGGFQAAFDRGRAVVVLRGGLLSCVDARLIGDDLSLLGNATLLADGRLAAAIRLVAPPEVASSIASRAFPGLPEPPALTNLSTPQRSAFDVEVSGDIRHIFLRAGAQGPVIGIQPYNPP